MAYADGFLIPVPTKNLDAYRKMSEKAGKVWMEYGALDYKECAGDDMTAEGATFPKTLVTKKTETVVFSWIVYKDKAHRDAVLKAVMADPRLAGMQGDDMPFDPKRMLYGGFSVIVDMNPFAAPKKTAKKAAPKKAAVKKKAAKRARG